MCLYTILHYTYLSIYTYPSLSCLFLSTSSTWAFLILLGGNRSYFWFRGHPTGFWGSPREIWADLPETEAEKCDIETAIFYISLLPIYVR